MSDGGFNNEWLHMCIASQLLFAGFLFLASFSTEGRQVLKGIKDAKAFSNPKFLAVLLALWVSVTVVGSYFTTFYFYHLIGGTN
jgi:hypothetical protein